MCLPEPLVAAVEVLGPSDVLLVRVDQETPHEALVKVTRELDKVIPRRYIVSKLDLAVIRDGAPSSVPG